MKSPQWYRPSYTELNYTLMGYLSDYIDFSSAV